MGVAETKSAVLACGWNAAAVTRSHADHRAPAGRGPDRPAAIGRPDALAGRLRPRPGRALRRRGPRPPGGVGLGRRRRPRQCRTSTARCNGRRTSCRPSPRSMGEGVCALSERGEITFMNPSGADMLGWFSLRDAAEGRSAVSELRDARFPPGAGQARAWRWPERHQLDTALHPHRRLALPRDHDRLARRRRRVALGRGDRVPRHLGAQGVRGAVGPPRVPGLPDRAGQPAAVARPPRPRARCRPSAPGVMSPFSSVISTASRRSTTNWATKSATSCCV